MDSRLRGNDNYEYNSIMDLGAWFSTWGMATSWDATFFAVLGLGAVTYGIAVGRDRAVLILVSMYIALAIVTNAPIIALFGNWLPQNPTLKLVWFLGLFLLIVFALWRSEIIIGMAQSRGTLIESATFAVLQVGLAVAITVFLLPMEVEHSLSPIARMLFSSVPGRSFWMIAPLVAIALFGRAGHDEDE